MHFLDGCHDFTSIQKVCLQFLHCLMIISYEDFPFFPILLLFLRFSALILKLLDGSYPNIFVPNITNSGSKYVVCGESGITDLK